MTNLTLLLWFWIVLLLGVVFFLLGYYLGKKRERDRYEREMEVEDE